MNCLLSYSACSLRDGRELTNQTKSRRRRNTMDAITFLKKFLAYAEYDPNQRTFNALSANYAFHRAIEQIKKISTYDPTGAFAVLYAKHSFISDYEHLIPKDLITDHPSRVHFQFTTGFSRRGWKKVLNSEIPKLLPDSI